jgi:hypothetical protein
MPLTSFYLLTTTSQGLQYYLSPTHKWLSCTCIFLKHLLSVSSACSEISSSFPTDLRKKFKFLPSSHENVLWIIKEQTYYPSSTQSKCGKEHWEAFPEWRGTESPTETLPLVTKGQRVTLLGWSKQSRGLSAPSEDQSSILSPHPSKEPITPAPRDLIPSSGNYANTYTYSDTHRDK